MHVCPMNPGEEEDVSRLVWHVFEEFDAPGHSEKGLAEFKNFISPRNIRALCDSGDFIVLCCKLADQLAGIIAVRGYEHVSLLFVRKEFQRKGVAKKLLQEALQLCCQTKSSLQHVTVNASRFSVGIYEKLGFKKVGPEQTKNGIIFTPMQYAFY